MQLNYPFTKHFVFNTYFCKPILSIAIASSFSKFFLVSQMISSLRIKTWQVLLFSFWRDAISSGTGTANWPNVPSLGNIQMNTERWLEKNWKEKLNISETNLFQCHVFQYKSHLDCPGSNLGTQPAANRLRTMSIYCLLLKWRPLDVEKFNFLWIYSNT